MSRTAHHAQRKPRMAWRVSGTRVLCALVSLFLIAPFLEASPYGTEIETLLVTVVLCAAVLSVGGTKRTLVCAVALSGVAILSRWMFLVWPAAVPQYLYLGAALLALAYIALHYLRFVVKARHVDADVLCTGISAFLLTALLWSMAYTMVDQAIPGSFILTTGGRCEEGDRRRAGQGW